MENEIQEYRILYHHLTERNRPHLVIYGEEEDIFTLSIAIASVRGPDINMKNDQRLHIKIAVAFCNRNPIPNFNDIRFQVLKQRQIYHDGEENPPHFWEVAEVPDFSRNWHGNIDVDLQNFPEVPHDMVWFQCFEDTPLDRIKNFMGAMKEKQGPDKYLVIEILYYLDPDFIQQLLRVRGIFEGYRFLGQDRRLTDQLFERGAYHEVVDDHLTLVFQRSQEATCKESTEKPDPSTRTVPCSTEASKESNFPLFNDGKMLIQLKEIVIFGDSNYTLHKALFNLRNKSQEGILFHPSNYHHHHLCYTHFALHTTRASQEPSPITIPCEALYMTSPIEADECTCKYDGKVVYYRCPPFSRRINIKRFTSFMQYIGRKQGNDDYLLIVLTRQSQYEGLDKKYKETLEGGKDLEGYKFLGEAKELTKQLCDHGFKDELQDEYIQYIKHIIHFKQRKFSDSAMAATKQEKREIPALKPISLVFQKV